MTYSIKLQASIVIIIVSHVYHSGAISRFFGPGYGPIHISNVGCVGSESMLSDCTSTAPRCGHNSDAGVQCLPGSGKTLYWEIIFLLWKRI